MKNFLKKGLIFENECAMIIEPWGISSAGRALHWQCRGQRFDPAMLHQSKNPVAKAAGFFVYQNHAFDAWFGKN